MDVEKRLEQILTDDPDDTIEGKLTWQMNAIRTLALAVCDLRKNQKWILRLMFIVLAAIVGSMVK